MLVDEGKAKISKAAFLQAEDRYSKYRLRSLQDEWIVEYPSLLEFSHLLKKKPQIFAISDMDPKVTSEFCLEYAISNLYKADSISVAARELAEAQRSVMDFREVSATLHETAPK